MWLRPASHSVAAHGKQTKRFIPYYIGVILLAMVTVAQAQDRAVVRLLTVDKNTQQPVADVELTVDAIQRTFTTNEAGVVTVLLPVSYYNVRASGLGIINQTFQIVVQRDTTFTFPVTVESRVLDEVEIKESRINEKAKHNVAGVETITPQQVQQLPMLAGEKDVVKSLTLLPGVQTGTEGSAQLLVRGGTSDQNLYLLDQATLYHSGHLLGFLSSFNPLATDSVTLYKGGFPARYGGRLSAILDARVKEANLDSLRVDANLGIISTKASVEVPLIRNKASLLLAGRRTYLDVFQRLASANKPVREQVSYSFYDFNGKGVYNFGPDHKLTAHYYQDRDSYFEIVDDQTSNSLDEARLTWRNRMMGLTWEHPLSPGVQHTLSLSNSRYGLEQKEVREQPKADNNYRASYTSSIQDISIKNNLRIALSDYFSLDAGVQLERYDTEPVTLRSQEAGQFAEGQTLPSQTAYQGALYGEGHLQWGAYTVDVGLRMSHYWVAQRGYFNPEPRLNIKRIINERDAVKLSYTRMAQPLHLLTDPGLGLPINLWVASNEQIAPQTAHQINGGYYTSFLAGNNNYSLSVEGYYKRMQDIVAYRDGYSSSSFTNQAQNGPARWETLVVRGAGASYGAEVLLEKTTGELTGWLAYTLSKTTHRFDALNAGEAFPSRYDRRHDLSLVMFYPLSDKWKFNATFSYATGQPVTLPVATYLGFSFDYERGVVDEQPALSYTQGERNSYRMKDFHRLDVALQRRLRWRQVTGTLELSVFNLYNRQNPYYYYADSSGARGGISTIKSVSLFPIIPSVSVSFSF